MLYVLDMKLPDGNGIMLCREIRRYTDNPILFLSAYDSEEFIVEGFAATYRYAKRQESEKRNQKRRI